MNLLPLTEYMDFTMNVKEFFSLKEKLIFSKGKRRYSIKLWKTFTDCFNCLPVAAVIDEKILCMHGGLSPELSSLDQIRRIIRPTDVPDTGNFFKKNPRE